MESGSPSLLIKIRKEQRKEVRDSILKKGCFHSPDKKKKSNLNIGEAASKPPPDSSLFCRYSLAGSCFNGSVIQKVQETTRGLTSALPFAWWWAKSFIA